MKKKANNTLRLIKAAANICRFLLAATFIFSGFVKANDPFGTTYKIEDYLSSFNISGLPETFILGCSILLALIEFGLGIYLFFGINRRFTSRLTLVFMSLMTLLTVYIAIANPVEDCGCFGDVLILNNWATLGKNIVLLAATILLVRYDKLQYQFIGSNTKWLISFFCLCYILGYAVFCVVNLPLFDFRPYKIGTNLREAVCGDAMPQFDVKIVYERNGERIELSPDEDDPDSTWSYVETVRNEIDASNVGSSDFYIGDAESGDDLTEDVLLEDGYTFLLIIPQLTNADEGCIDRVNEIYEYSQDNDYGFYCMTASSDQKSQYYWEEHTGAEYPYYLSEERMLKTVVRASPGLVLLKDGVIINKWSNYNLPTEQDFKDKLENLPIGEIEKREITKNILQAMLFFFAPLILLTLIDRIAMRWKFYREMKKSSKKIPIELKDKLKVGSIN